MEITCQNCGLINDFRIIKKNTQDTCWCNGCDSFIKNMPQGKPPMLFFGKYKDRLIQSMTSYEEVNYLNWLIKQDFCKENLKSQIQAHLTVLTNV